MRTIKAGDLRQVITLLKPVSAKNDAGRRVTTWEEIPEVPAARSDISGREFWQAQAFHAEDVVTYTIRWRDDVTQAWRVRHGETVYNIIEVNHLGYMRDFMRLRCRMVQQSGS